VDKTFAAIEKLKEVELELHRLKNYAEMMNRSVEAQREWQGLTDEEMLDTYAPNRIPDSAYSNMGEDLKKIHDATKEEMLSGLRAIEAKLKEKNNG
jgi:hypothetical protein